MVARTEERDGPVPTRGLVLKRRIDRVGGISGESATLVDPHRLLSPYGVRDCQVQVLITRNVRGLILRPLHLDRISVGFVSRVVVAVVSPRTGQIIDGSLGDELAPLLIGDIRHRPGFEIANDEGGGW